MLVFFGWDVKRWQVSHSFSLTACRPSFSFSSVVVCLIEVGLSFAFSFVLHLWDVPGNHNSLQLVCRYNHLIRHHVMTSPSVLKRGWKLQSQKANKTGAHNAPRRLNYCWLLKCNKLFFSASWIEDLLIRVNLEITEKQVVWWFNGCCYSREAVSTLGNIFTLGDFLPLWESLVSSLELKYMTHTLRTTHTDTHTLIHPHTHTLNGLWAV